MKSNKIKLWTISLFTVLFSVFAIFGIKAYADKYGMQESYPQIYIDLEGNESAPYGVVGKNYEIFNAKAVGETSSSTYETTKEVFFDYYSTKRISVDIEDNYFTPRHEGTYTIVFIE